MILAIDAGNTRIKWGLYDGVMWRASGAVLKTEIVRLNEAWKSLPNPETVMISNVAGPLIRSELGVLTGRWRVATQWIEAHAAQCGVTNHYERPQQLGCDRWAALIGARHIHQGACVVVMAGTAITVDALTEDGQFLGGLILPGLEMMVEALSSKTAGIRVEAGEYQVFPVNTRSAVWSAAIHAAAGAAERMRAALAGRSPGPVSLLLSGGAAPVLEPHLTAPLERVDNLVLEGLVRMAQT